VSPGRLPRPLRATPALTGADLAIAATVVLIGGRLLTVNVRHFPMFPDLRVPY